MGGARVQVSECSRMTNFCPMPLVKGKLLYKGEGLHLQAPIPRIFDGSASDGMAWYTSSDGKARCSDSADQDVFT